MDKIKNTLKKDKIEFIENLDIVEISTIKISQIISLAIFPKTIKELIFILQIFYKNKIKYKVVGNCSNLLFVSKIDFAVIFTNKMKDEFEISGNIVTVSSGMQLPKVIDISRKNKLGGLEKLVGIPATVGGAIMNNAGAFGCNISSKLLKISAFYNGKVIDVSAGEIKFGYHFSNLVGFVLLSASFFFENKNEYDIINLCNEFTYKRTIMQPCGFSLGSVYQKINGKSAGFYIERAGLKNTRVGGIVVSSKHANFFINDKSGSYEDFFKLQTIVENKVAEQFGLKLISEIEKVGEEYETSCRSPHSF